MAGTTARHQRARHPKKHHIFRQGCKVRYAFGAELLVSSPVRTMCRWLAALQTRQFLRLGVQLLSKRDTMFPMPRWVCGLSSRSLCRRPGQRVHRAGPSLIKGRQGALTQQIQLILLETALQSQQQSVIPVVDRHVSTTRQISMICWKSRLLRVKRDTSRVATAPTLPRPTAATIRSSPLA